MNLATAPPDSSQAELEEFWEELLTFVEDRRVIPIVGPDLLMAPDGQTLGQMLARKLADRLRQAASDLPPAFTLNDVVCRHLQAHGKREDIYPKIRAIMKELPLAPPESLSKLARIRDFDLYVSLSFDSLLADALNQVRFGGAPRTDHLGYAPNKVQDLPAERARLAAPVVYSLLGKLSAAQDYVISDEDTLEYLYALQSEAKRPHLLFDELQNNHLLFLGCSFPDWLARFFIRIAKSRQLSAQRGETEILVDGGIAHDAKLVVFLQSFSYNTRIVPMEPAAFVDELERRWSQRHPQGVSAPASATQSSLPDMLPGAIFLSYAKEDHAAAERIRNALEALGLDVWFDKERLEAGDQYDQKIRRNIKGCAIFLPVISHNTERRVEAYFRLEWSLAAERSRIIAANVPFILPVVIDDTHEYSESVPEAFGMAQWTRLADGQTTPEFGSRLVQLVRDFRKRLAGLA